MKTTILRFFIAALAVQLLFNINAGAQTWNVPAPSGGTSSLFLGTTDATDLSLRTNGVERAKIFGNGSGVKIGASHLILGNSGSSYINFPTNGHLYFRNLSDVNNPYSSSTNRMVLTNTGKVGIGITNPSANLDIKGDNAWLQVGNLDNASIHLAAAYCDGCWSNSALNNDVILSTSTGNSGNLLIQAKNPGKAIKFITNNGTFLGVRMMINDDGRVAIGHTDFTKAAGYMLSVAGKVVCEELKVKLQANWPDFVFAKNHELMSLEEVESFIQENNHLPNVPSAGEVSENGIEAGEMFRIQMQKIEELTLYMIDLKNKYKEVKEENVEMKRKIEVLEKN